MNSIFSHPSWVFFFFFSSYNMHLLDHSFNKFMCMYWETVTDYLFYLFYILLLYSFTVTAICCGLVTDPCPSNCCELGKFSLLGSIDLWMCLILTVCLLRIFCLFCWHADSKGWDAACGEAHL